MNYSTTSRDIPFTCPESVRKKLLSIFNPQKAHQDTKFHFRLEIDPPCFDLLSEITPDFGNLGTDGPSRPAFNWLRQVCGTPIFDWTPTRLAWSAPHHKRVIEQLTTIRKFLLGMKKVKE